jgi:hypothetical protein
MTLTELRDAYASGATDTPLMLDNDSVYAYVDGKEVFTSDPYQLLRDALDLLGIPHENV